MSTEIDTGNYQAVAVSGDGDHITVLAPRQKMTKAQALLHAAWIVALADADSAFAEILYAVRNT